MKYTNKANLPEIIQAAIEKDPYQASYGKDDFTKDKQHISVTRLIQPPRIRILENEFADEIEEDVADRVYALLGQSVHHIIERGKKRPDIIEKRLFYGDKTSHIEENLTKGWLLSGQFDLLTKQGQLIDYKVTSAWSCLAGNSKPEWEQQLNLYAFLCRKNQEDLVTYKKEIKVKGLSILAILRDWSKRKAQESSSYPQKQIQMIPIPLWSDEEQDKFVQERMKAHQEAQKSGEPPVCSPQERWHKDDTLALYVDGKAKCKRVLKTKEDMDKYLEQNNLVEGKGCRVVLRKGEDTRCEHYCNVNQFCDYYMDSKATIF